MNKSIIVLVLFAILSGGCWLGCSDDSTSPPPPPPPAQPADDWAVNDGGGGFDYGYGAVADSAGNVYVAGKYTGTADFGDTTFTDNGSGDVFVVKYDKDGNYLWAVRAGGTAVDDAQAIAADGSGNVYITGQFTGTASFGSFNLFSAGSQDIFVAKLDPAGTFLWAERAGGTSFESGLGIAANESGSVVVTGFFRGSFTYGTSPLSSAGQSDIFIAKYDPAGNVSWAKQAGASDYDNGEAVTFDPSGRAVVTGSFVGTIQFGANTLISAGNRDVFVVMYDASGNVVWARNDGGTSADVGYGVAADPYGNTYVTGYFLDSAEFGFRTVTGSGNGDVFLAKYNSDGDVVQAVSAGGTEYERGLAIAADRAGNVVIAGAFRGTSVFGNTTLISTGNDDIFIAKYDPLLVALWAWGAGSGGDDRGYGITVDRDYYVTGTGIFGNTVQFGRTSLTAAGATDVFVFRTGPGGI